LFSIEIIKTLWLNMRCRTLVRPKYIGEHTTITFLIPPPIVTKEIIKLIKKAHGAGELLRLLFGSLDDPSL